RDEENHPGDRGDDVLEREQRHGCAAARAAAAVHGRGSAAAGAASRSKGVSRSRATTFRLQYSLQLSSRSCSCRWVTVSTSWIASAATRATKVVSNAVERPPVTSRRTGRSCWKSDVS